MLYSVFPFALKEFKSLQERLMIFYFYQSLCNDVTKFSEITGGSQILWCFSVYYRMSVPFLYKSKTAIGQVLLRRTCGLPRAQRVDREVRDSGFSWDLTSGMRCFLGSLGGRPEQSNPWLGRTRGKEFREQLGLKSLASECEPPAANRARLHPGKKDWTETYGSSPWGMGDKQSPGYLRIETQSE